MDYFEFFEEWRDGSETIRCMTSGSTGRPHEILLPKREMKKSAWRTIDFFGLSSDSVIYSCISPDYIGGKMQAVRAAELTGEETGKMLPKNFHYETPSNRPLMGWSGGRIDLLSVVPSQMEWIVSRKDEMPEFGAILVGGSAIPYTIRKAIEESGLPAWESYGMTETSSHIALRRIQESPEMFRPLRGISVSLEEEQLAIEMEGWQRLITNDIAKIGEGGRFEIHGRADNVIISGGKKIQPEKVEQELEKVLRCEYAISSRSDSKWGERVVLVIEGSEQSDEEILQKCKSVLSRHEVPKEIIRKRIPRTENGKISRNSLKNLLVIK